MTAKSIPATKKPPAKKPPTPAPTANLSSAISQINQSLNILAGQVRELKEAPPKAPLIDILIPQIIAEIEPIAKQHYNEEGKFNFRMIDEMTTPLSEIFGRLGIYITPVDADVVSQEKEQSLTNEGRPYILFYTTVKCRYEICASDGSKRSTCALGKGMSDMHFDVSIAQTDAFKKMIVQLFMIPIGTMDPDNEGQRATTLPPTSVASSVIPYKEPTASDVIAPQPSLFGEEPGVPEFTQNTGSFVEDGSDKKKSRKPKTEAAPDTPMSPNTLSILHTHLVQSEKKQEDLLKHFQVQVMEDLKQSQMGAVLDWIKE